MKKLFILDAYALIFRSYYAFINRPIINTKGLNTSAIFGFVNTLLEILTKEKPDYIAVAFDFPGPNFRHKIFKEYKSNRPPTPEGIKTAVPYIKDILSAFNIPVYEIEGYEADDTIGTMAKKAEKLGFTVYMMTPDKDYAQLVSENIFMYKPRRSGSDVDILGVEEVKQKFSIENPLQVIDILALWGDSSDNIPGAPGIGEKTSKKLIKEFGSVENIIANIDKLKGRQKLSIEENKEQVLLSKDLATIRLDVPVEINETDLKLQAPDIAKITSIYDDIEFKRFLARTVAYANSLSDEKIDIPIETPKTKPVQGGAVQGDLFAAAGVETIQKEKNTIKNVNHKYILVDDDEKLDLLISSLEKSNEFCFDTETTSINAVSADLLGVSFSVKEHEAFYLPVAGDTEFVKQKLLPLTKFFNDETKLKIGQNIKYDIIVLSNYDIEVKANLFDTMIAHYLIEPDLRHNLNYLSENYLDYTPVKIEELIGKKGNMKNVPVEVVSDYACEDADLTYQLKQKFAPQLKENELYKLFEEIEMPLIKVLASMEIAGVSLDAESVKDYSKKLKQELISTQEKIYELAGKEFNIASPKQLGEVLFDDLKVIDKPKMTKTKQYKTGEEILVKLKDKHPIINEILEYRSLAKLISTYVEPLPLLINSKTNRIHTSYNQAVAATGRLSSTNPNLQNIPIREERGREIRKFFVSKEDFVFVSADYSQVELRIMAHLSEDENMISAFKNNEDIHLSTAAKIAKKPISEVTSKERSHAKSANFGIIYGISAFGLAENLSVSRKDAKQLIDNYFETYPKVKQYMDNSITMAREKGYAETIFERKRILKDINSQNHMIRSLAERNAINAPIQGSSADIIKIAMINIYNKMQKNNMKSKMIMQVHDELNFDVAKDELEKMKEIIKYEMENAVKLKVSLTVDIGVGSNWYEAH